MKSAITLCLILVAIVTTIPGLLAMDLGHADTTVAPVPPEQTSEDTPDNVISIHALKDSWTKWKASRKQQAAGQPALFWDPAQGCDCDFTMECVSDRECHNKGERDECHLSDCCGTFCVSIG